VADCDGLFGIASAGIKVMPHLKQLRAGWRWPAMAGLMAFLLLLLGVLAAEEQIHSQLHADEPASHATCSICALAGGLVDAPASFQPVVVPVLSPAWTVPALESAPLPAADFSVASSRGPPVFISSL
jgi:hypothetical protein